MTNGNGLLASRVSYLPQVPVFAVTPVWRLLGLSDPAALTPQQKEIMGRVGAWAVIGRLPQRLEDKVGSRELSPNEARRLTLARILLATSTSVWVLDVPLDGRSLKKAHRQLDAILESAGERTVIVSVSPRIDLTRFDRVLELRDGRIHYDGAPAAESEPDLSTTKSP